MPKRWTAVVLAVLALCAGGRSAAQVNVGAGGGAGGAYALEEGERNLKFAGLPIPGYSDVLGWNLGAVAMAYYKTDRRDDALPPSSTGLFGFYSENKSWMGGLFQQLHLPGDRWRITAALGTGSIRYQFNPAAIGPGFPDVFLDYTTVTNFVFAQGARRVRGGLFLGLGVMSWSAKVGIEPDLVELPDERYTGPGIVGEWDRRDHTMTPTDGFQVDARYLVYRDAFGSDRDFQRLHWSVAGFRALGDSTRVLAGRLLHQGAFGDVPFSAQSIVNGNQNLRGYANGRHRADQLVVVEAEYRWNFWRRWGAAAFAGAVWNADRIGDMSLEGTLPGAGVGVRFRIIETYRINARIDYGWGRHDQAIYFAIGEHY